MTKQEAIKGTLAWCNKKRVEQGKEPLADLPKGYAGDPLSCPCGAATGLNVGTHAYCEIDEEGNFGHDYRLPLAVKEFVFLFDKDEIPEYLRRSILQH